MQPPVSARLTHAKLGIGPSIVYLWRVSRRRTSILASLAAGDCRRSAQRFTLALVGLGVWWPADAAAIEWAPNSPPTYVSKHHGVQNAISRRDCLDKDVLQFLFEDGTPGNELQVWGTQDATADCTDPQDQLSGICVPLGTFPIGTTQLTAAISTTQIVSPIFAIDELQCSGGSSLPAEVKITFLETDGVITVGALVHMMTVDLLGPQAPVVNGVTPIEPQSLLLSVTPAQAVEPYAGVVAFCLPASVNPCGAVGLGAGQTPDDLEASGLSSVFAEVTASELTDNLRYACGVCGLDFMNNRGQLSNIGCATTGDAPDDEVDDGCGCTVARSQPGSLPSWAWLLAAIVLTQRTSKRRARTSR